LHVNGPPARRAQPAAARHNGYDFRNRSKVFPAPNLFMGPHYCSTKNAMKPRHDQQENKMSAATSIRVPMFARAACPLAFLYLTLAALMPAPASAATGTESLSFVMQSFPPFTFEKQGKVQGPFPEVVNAACKAMQVECRLTVYPWRRALRMAENGSADGILVIQKMSDRMRHFYLTDPVICSSYGLYVHQDSTLHDASAAQLADHTVGVYGPSATSRTAAALLKSVPTARLEVETDNLTVLKKLGAQRYGENGAAIVNVDVASYLIKQDGLTRLRLAGEVKQIAYLIGLSKRSVSAAQAGRFRAALRQLRDDGTLQKIAKKYGMRAAGPSVAAPRR
jgi:polar amino acid transport system substrate-binding protein